MVSPQVKKIRDLRSTGVSLREIAERLNITRSKVEEALAVPEKIISKSTNSKTAAPTSEKKDTVTKKEVTPKGK